MIPAFDPVRATQAPEPPATAAIPVEVITLPVATARPAGRRFGALVHAILEEIDLDAGRDEITALAKIHQRLTGATQEEFDGAVASVSGVLKHNVLHRARSSPHCHREMPIMVKASAKTIVEGVIDLTFEEDGHWVVVDFKTTADIEARRPEYERQIQWYGYALQQSTGSAVRGILLGI